MDDKEKKKRLEETAGMLRVLGHPDRLRILACLMHKKCFVNDLAEKMGLPQSTVSQHLRVMTDRGILIGERHGVKVCYKPASFLAESIARMLLSNCE